MATTTQTDADLKRQRKASQKKPTKDENKQKEVARVPVIFARTPALQARQQVPAAAPDDPKTYRHFDQNLLRVTGGVLGDAHRSLLYAVFCRRETPLVVERQGEFVELLEYRATWRGLLKDLGLEPHPNLIPRYLGALQDLQRIEIREMTVTADKEYLRPSPPLIDEITYEGASLRHCVTVRFRPTIAKMVRDRHLMSLDMKVYNRLRKPLARALWPIINGSRRMFFYCEQDLAPFLGFPMDVATRREWEAFRRTCERAFDELHKMGAVPFVKSEGKAGRCGERRLRRYVFRDVPETERS